MMGSGDERLIMFEDVERMELLDRCLKESLRLFPIVPILGREATADLKLSWYIRACILSAATNV